MAKYHWTPDTGIKATEQTDQIFRDEAASVIATSRLYYDKAVKEFDNDRSTG